MIDSLELAVSREGVTAPSDDNLLQLHASIQVDDFAGRGAFVVTPTVLAAFADQLDQLVAEGSSARLECGLVEVTSDVAYFACQIDADEPHGSYLVQVSLGTAGANGLLHRMHVGLRVPTPSVVVFGHGVRTLLANQRGAAVLATP